MDPPTHRVPLSQRRYEKQSPTLQQKQAVSESDEAPPHSAAVPGQAVRAAPVVPPPLSLLSSSLLPFPPLHSPTSATPLLAPASTSSAHLLHLRRELKLALTHRLVLLVDLARYRAGSHELKALIDITQNRTFNNFVPNSLGSFYFDSLADFQAGRANSVQYAATIGGDPLGAE